MALWPLQNRSGTKIYMTEILAKRLVIAVLIAVRATQKFQNSAVSLVLSLSFSQSIFSRFNAPAISMVTEKFAKICLPISSHMPVTPGKFCLILLLPS